MSIALFIMITLAGMGRVLQANDTRVIDKDEYYKEAIGLRGYILRTKLHDIVNDHVELKYTNSNNKDWTDGKDVDVWEGLLMADSACPDVVGCSKVRLLYLNESRGIEFANRGTYGANTWEREHVWPKARGGIRKSHAGYTDLHHIRPADSDMNRQRGYLGFAEGGRTVHNKIDVGKSVKTTAKVNRDNDSFEPPNFAKGQVARMVFYMAVRYNGKSGAGRPDLKMVTHTDNKKAPTMGNLCILLEWNNMFGPTDFERRRNEVIYSLQGNRNPFIDNPGWANVIWGHKCR